MKWEQIIEGWKSILDWFTKLASRLKGLGLIIAIIMTIIFVINNGCNRRQAEKLFEKVTGLNIQNDILLNENKSLDKAIEYKDSLLAVKQFKIDSISARESQKEREAAYWKDRHGKIAGELIKITSDSSYQFLQSVFNFPGIKKYGFNEPQVKGLHQIYLENENKEEQLTAITAALFECKTGKEMMDEVGEIKKSKYEDRSIQYENSQEVIDNKNEELELTQKQLKRKTNWGKVKNGAIVVAFIVGLAIGL